ncbi:MAG: cell division protein ZapA [Deltaproteobacteria bacterium]|nr:cell division protein ZapA [Deltaproteobacteria bacterium]
MKKRYAIRVMGLELSVLSDKGDEYVERVVHYVNQKAKEIRTATENASTVSIALLVALNIADELFTISDEKEVISTAIEGRAEKLLDYIHTVQKNT